MQTFSMNDIPEMFSIQRSLVTSRLQYYLVILKFLGNEMSGIQNYELQKIEKSIKKHPRVQKNNLQNFLKKLENSQIRRAFFIFSTQFESWSQSYVCANKRLLKKDENISEINANSMDQLLSRIMHLIQPTDRFPYFSFEKLLNLQTPVPIDAQEIRDQYKTLLNNAGITTGNFEKFFRQWKKQRSRNLRRKINSEKSQVYNLTTTYMSQEKQICKQKLHELDSYLQYLQGTESYNRNRPESKEGTLWYDSNIFIQRESLEQIIKHSQKLFKYQQAILNGADQEEGFCVEQDYILGSYLDVLSRNFRSENSKCHIQQKKENDNEMFVEELTSHKQQQQISQVNHEKAQLEQKIAAIDQYLQKHKKRYGQSGQRTELTNKIIDDEGEMHEKNHRKEEVGQSKLPGFIL